MSWITTLGEPDRAPIALIEDDNGSFLILRFTPEWLPRRFREKEHAPLAMAERTHRYDIPPYIEGRDERGWFTRRNPLYKTARWEMGIAIRDQTGAAYAVSIDRTQDASGWRSW